MALWIELRLEFETAFRENNADKVNRILKYARWSWNTRNEDAVVAVNCAFFEHLPEDEKMREKIPQWFSRLEFDQLRDVFTYHAGAETVAAIEKRYLDSRKR